MNLAHGPRIGALAALLWIASCRGQADVDRHGTAPTVTDASESESSERADPEPCRRTTRAPGLGFLTRDLAERVGSYECPGLAFRDVGDVDGDGVRDVGVVPAGSSDSLRIVSSTTGALLREHSAARPSTEPIDVAGIGDVDEDGHGDYVIGLAFRRFGGPLVGLRLVTISGADGTTIAERDVGPCGRDVRLGGSSALARPGLVLVARSRPEEPIPTLILEGRDLSPRATLPVAQRGEVHLGAVLADRDSDGEAELLRFELRLGRDEASLVEYSARSGTRVGAVFSYLRDREADVFIGDHAISAGDRLHAQGDSYRHLVSVDLASGRRLRDLTISGTQCEWGGILVVEDADSDGLDDLLIGSTAGEPPSGRGSVTLHSSATGRQLPLRLEAETDDPPR